MKAREIAGASLLAALAAAMEILPLDVPFPPLKFLTFDPTGIPLTLALYVYGLPSSLISTLIAAFIISLPRPPFKPANPIGGFFKGLAEASTLLGIWLAVKLFKKKSLLLALTSSLAVRVIVMDIANYLLLPVLYGIPINVVISLIPPISVFNAIQGGINILAGYYFYKAVKKVYTFESFW